MTAIAFQSASYVCRIDNVGYCIFYLACYEFSMTLLSMSSRISEIERPPSVREGFDSFRGFRFVLCSTLVSCWSFHFPISIPSLKFTIFIHLPWYKIAMQRSLVVYHGMLHLSLDVYSWYINSPEGSCVYREYHSKALHNYIVFIQTWKYVSLHRGNCSSSTFAIRRKKVISTREVIFYFSTSLLKQLMPVLLRFLELLCYFRGNFLLLS